MPIYFKSDSLKVAIYYFAEGDDNGVFIFGDEGKLREIAKIIAKEKPDLKFLQRECVASFNEKKGSCLYFPINENLDCLAVEDFKEDLVLTTKYFKDLINSECLEENVFEYTDQAPEKLEGFFDESNSTFFVRVDNWQHLEFEIKRKYIYAFLDIMSKSSNIKIIGDGGVKECVDNKKKAYAIIVTSEGFGWRFAGTPKRELLDSLFASYSDRLASFPEEDLNKYKISGDLIRKINWLSSMDPFRW